VDSGVSSNYDMNSDAMALPASSTVRISSRPRRPNLTTSATVRTWRESSPETVTVLPIQLSGVYRASLTSKYLNLRALDSNGMGTDSSVIAAIQQAIALKSTYNIRVLNLSLARGVYESYTLDRCARP